MQRRQQATLFCSLFLIGSAEVVAGPMMAQMGRSFGVASSQIAYLPAAYGLAYAPVALLAGPLSDRWGRKRPLQLGLFGFALLCLLMAFVHTLAAAVALAALTGVCAAVIQPNSLSLVGDASPPDQVARRLGHTLAGLMLAFVITPAVAGVVADAFGWPASYLLLSALAWMALAAVTLVFPTRPRTAMAPSQEAKPARGFWAAHRGALCTPDAARRLSASYLWLGWVAGFGALAAQVCARKLGLTPTEAGLLAGWFGLVIVAGNLSGPWLQSRLGDAALPLSALTAAVGIAAFLLPLQQMVSLAIAGIPWAFAYGAAGPLHHGRLSNLSVTFRGTLNSYHAALLNLGIFSVSLLMGTLSLGAADPKFCILVAFVATCGTWPLLGDLAARKPPAAAPDARRWPARQTEEVARGSELDRT
ncbi:MAG: MFS transporter [Aquabacterium sp.]